MLLDELVSLCKGRISSGYETDEGSIDNDRVIELIGIGRPVIIPELLKTYKKVHPDWMQEFFPVYDARKQESTLYTVFDGIPNIVLHTIQTAIQYVGNDECFEQFRVCYSSGEYANLCANPLTDPRTNKNVYALYENMIWKVFNRKKHTRITKFKVNGVWSNPFDVPTWNPDMHNYPIDPKGADLIKNYVYQNYLLDTLKTPANTISNSQEDSKIPARP